MILDPSQGISKKAGRQAFEQCNGRHQGVTDSIPHKAYGRRHMSYFGKPR